jgi:uncharacterized iron-regulated membrane protein
MFITTTTLHRQRGTAVEIVETEDLDGLAESPKLYPQLPVPRITKRAAATAETPEESVGATSRPFPYRQIFWKWHLYAGLFGSPLLILIALTGAVLVFAPEIDRAMRPDLWRIEPPRPAALSDSSISDQSVVDAVRKRFPMSKILSYRQSGHADEPYQVLMLTPDIKGVHDAWVNPHTAEIVGDRHREWAFVRIMEQLHRRLLTGEVGSSVIEFITGWGIVLALTGTYLWWPKTLKQLRQGLTVCIRGGAYKVNWRLHSTVGAWTAVVLLLLSVSGMVFSTYSGGMFNRISAATGGRKNLLSSPPRSKATEGAEPVSLDTILASARAAAPPNARFNIQLPREKDSSVVVTLLRPERATWADCQKYGVWCFDQYSGELLATSGWEQMHPMAKFRLFSLVLHFGSIFGLPTKIMAVLACLAVPVLAATGYLIWWWKRLSKAAAMRRSGPRRDSVAPPAAPISRWVVACLVGLGLVFPTIGVSFLLVAAYEAAQRMWQRKYRSENSFA